MNAYLAEATAQPHVLQLPAPDLPPGLVDIDADYLDAPRLLVMEQQGRGLPHLYYYVQLHRLPLSEYRLQQQLPGTSLSSVLTRCP